MTSRRRPLQAPFDPARATIDRRTFLGLALGPAAAMLVGCGDDAASSGGSETGSGSSSTGAGDESTGSGRGESTSGALDTTGADESTGGGSSSESGGDTGQEACEPEVRIIEFDPDALPQDDAVFPLAVMAGEMRPESVMLAIWIPDAQPKLLRVWTAGERPGTVALAFEEMVAPNAAGYAKITVDGLCPGLWYSYAYFVEAGGEITARSAIGNVRTAIADDALEPLVIAMSSCNGDAGGSYTWPALDAMADEYYDMFLHLGDMAYNDGMFTLEEYRANWRQYLGAEGFKRVYAAAGLYATWDDHEIDDNSGFDPRSMDPMDLERRENALSAYFELLPIDGGPPDFQIWRTFRWGLTAEIIVLDCRYERRASRDIYISQAQMDFLKERLMTSPCHFKIVMNSVPITNMPGVWDIAANDRWEGYPAQRDELLGFIDDNDIGNVWFLSGDFHVNFVSRLEPAGDNLSARTREIACTGGNTNLLGALLAAPQYDYGSSEPRGVILMFDPESNAVNVRFIDGTTGTDDYNESLTQG
jgi:phosphodiesterase/alkaline phosphatase D-like protein